MDEPRPIPPDLERCQVERPSTWPHMPTFMTFGPVSYKRCGNVPTWIADDGEGRMSVCGDCKPVVEQHIKATYRPFKLGETVDG